MTATVKGLETTSAAMMSAQKELTTALRNLSDSHGGIVAQVECANDRIRNSMENRVKVLDALLHEWKNDMLRIWMPLVAGAALLIGLFAGMGIQGWRDSAPAATATPTPATVRVAPAPQQEAAPIVDAKRPYHIQATAKSGADRER